MKYLFWGRIKFFRVIYYDWKIRIGYMVICDKVYMYVISVKLNLENNMINSLREEVVYRICEDYWGIGMYGVILIWL